MTKRKPKSKNSKPERMGWIPFNEHKPTRLTKENMKGVNVSAKEIQDHLKKFGDRALLVP